MDRERDLRERERLLRSDDLVHLVELARSKGIVDDASAADGEVLLRIGALETIMHPVEALVFLRRALFVCDVNGSS